jgi:hypothetical protein
MDRVRGLYGFNAGGLVGKKMVFDFVDDRRENRKSS